MVGQKTPMIFLMALSESGSSSFHFKIPKNITNSFLLITTNNIINNKNKVIVYNKVKHNHKESIITTESYNNIQRDLN